ncbi:hypothetical protein ABZ023_25995 [Streptomyces sp. NPDC006367]|uniref:hypothetical protein n=1 Tax=unclassified Streptomyces TaxID=2593676 RepID=UPI0033B3EC6C
MEDAHIGGLDAAAAEIVGNSVAHWVSHTFGPGVYELYTDELRAMHERLHEELMDLLPAEADASIWVVIELDAVDTAVPCAVHPLYATVPAADTSGRWFAGMRIHRHDDGSPGVEADNDMVCHLLCALASYGGSVLVGVHQPREVIEHGAPESPLAAAARWRVEPVGSGLPQRQRPTLLISPGGPFDPAASAARMAVEITPPAGGPSNEWKAITGSLWDAPAAYDPTEWRETDPDCFLDALEQAALTLSRCPELSQPVVAAAIASNLRRAAGNAEAEGDSYIGAVLETAAAHVAGEQSLFEFTRALTASGQGDPTVLAVNAMGFIAYYWQAALTGALLLPTEDPTAEDDQSAGFQELRALIGRELSRR